MSVTEFAEIVGISRNAGYQAVDRGDVRSIKLGHRILIPRTEIQRLLEPAAAAPISQSIADGETSPPDRPKHTKPQRRASR